MALGIMVKYNLVPSPTPSFSSDEKLGVGLGTRLGQKQKCISAELFGIAICEE